MVKISQRLSSYHYSPKMSFFFPFCFHISFRRKLVQFYKKSITTDTAIIIKSEYESSFADSCLWSLKIEFATCYKLPLVGPVEKNNYSVQQFWETASKKKKEYLCAGQGTPDSTTYSTISDWRESRIPGGQFFFFFRLFPLKTILKKTKKYLMFFRDKMVRSRAAMANRW